MITTVKALKENLTENFTDTESIYVLFFSKEEFESNFTSKVTNKIWETALAVVDDEEADAIIQNQIADELSTLLDEKE